MSRRTLRRVGVATVAAPVIHCRSRRVRFESKVRRRRAREEAGRIRALPEWCGLALLAHALTRARATAPFAKAAGGAMEVAIGALRLSVAKLECALGACITMCLALNASKGARGARGATRLPRFGLKMAEPARRTKRRRAARGNFAWGTSVARSRTLGGSEATGLAACARLDRRVHGAEMATGAKLTRARMRAAAIVPELAISTLVVAGVA